MKDPLKEFLRVKEDAEEKRAEANRLAGAKQQLVQQLANEGCETLADAKAELANVEKELKMAERELAKGIEAYDKKWGER